LGRLAHLGSVQATTQYLVLVFTGLYWFLLHEYSLAGRFFVVYISSVVLLLHPFFASDSYSFVIFLLSSKQHKSCPPCVFRCFCSPFSFSYSLLFFSGQFIGLKSFLFGRPLGVPFPIRSRMRASLGWNWITGEGNWTGPALVEGPNPGTKKKKPRRSFSWRSAKKRRYLIRRKIRVQCRREAVVYLRFLYDLLVSEREG